MSIFSYDDTANFNGSFPFNGKILTESFSINIFLRLTSKYLY